jgi:protein-disulfide isomerase
VEPELIEKYVKDGTLRIEWRDFPYQGQESVNAALAARSAQAQGKFWEYHDMLYHNQSSGNSGGYSDENLVALAREMGLDTQRFERDFESARYGGTVQADFQEGQNLGISGTPTFFINDNILVGFQPLGVFERAIEDAEREAGGG